MKGMAKLEGGMFCEIVGDSPRNAILEFFIEGMESDYGIGDVARDLGLNRVTAYNASKELIKEKFIVPSRKLGKTQLFKLNIKDKKAKMLIRFFNEILAEGAKKYAN